MEDHLQNNSTYFGSTVSTGESTPDLDLDSDDWVSLLLQQLAASSDGTSNGTSNTNTNSHGPLGTESNGIHSDALRNGSESAISNATPSPFPDTTFPDIYPNSNTYPDTYLGLCPDPEIYLNTHPNAHFNTNSILNTQVFDHPTTTYDEACIPPPSQSWQGEVCFPNNTMHSGSLDWYPGSEALLFPIPNSALLFDHAPDFYDQSAVGFPLLNNEPIHESLGAHFEDSNGLDMQIIPWKDTLPFNPSTHASTPKFRSADDIHETAIMELKNNAPTRSKKTTAPTRGKAKKLHGPSSRIDPITSDKAPKSNMIKDGKGKLQGVFNVFGARARVRSTYTEEARALTARSRKQGVCDRCRRFKARCDMPDSLYEPCKRCSQVVGGVLRQPCIRVSFIGISLHRIGSTKDNSLNNWLNARQHLAIETGLPENRPRKLLVTQDYGFELEVTVAKFQAGPRDKTSFPWRDASGVAREMEMPHFYMVDLEETERALNEYNRRSYIVYIQKILRDKNPIVWTTFQAAIRYSASGKSPLVQDALRFWSGVRLLERPWRICGTDKLGLSPSEDVDSPWHGGIPVTPMMDTQLDHLVIESFLTSLREQILQQLFEKIMKKKKEDWFEIYLAIFVLMNNIERVFVQVSWFTSFYGVLGKFGSRGTSSLSESFIHSSKTMLAYFHYAYNGAALLSAPLDKSHEDMPKEQVAYIRAIQEEVARQGDHLNTLKDKSMYETDMYWCHQLLLKDCQLDKQNEKEIDELQEDDYILHSQGDE